MYPRLSWSTLQSYEECPQKFLLHRQRKRAPIPERYVIKGNVVHYAAEQMAIGRKTVERIVEAAERDFDRRCAEALTLGWDAEERAEERAKIAPAVYRLDELIGPMFENQNGDVISELHLYEFYQGWALEGYIDLAIRGNFLIDEVWDIKTGSSHKVGQLQFYSVLVEAYYGRRPERFGWVEPMGRGLVPVTVTDDEHHEMKLRIMRAVAAINENQFPTAGFPKKCGYCSSRDFCPATAAARSGKLG